MTPQEIDQKILIDLPVPFLPESPEIMITTTK